jgi:hypothetical protein
MHSPTVERKPLGRMCRLVGQMTVYTRPRRGAGYFVARCLRQGEVGATIGATCFATSLQPVAAPCSHDPGVS